MQMVLFTLGSHTTVMICDCCCAGFSMKSLKWCFALCYIQTNEKSIYIEKFGDDVTSWPRLPF